MKRDKRIAAFLTLAEEELQAARVLARPAPRQAAYYVHQAIEKATRALLEAAGVPFGRSHNIGEMAQHLPSDHPLKATAARFDRHSPAATRYRYPSETGRLIPAPLPEAVEADLAEVGAYLIEVRRLVGEHIAGGRSGGGEP
jgi:HEPN domain-containing protein